MGAYKQQKIEKEMARKKGVTGKVTQGSSLCFVNLRLTEDDKKRARLAGHESITDCLVDLLTYVEDGHKLTLNYNDDRQFYVVTLMGWNEGCTNKGYALSGEGKDPYLALGSLWVKLSRVGVGVPWSDFVVEDDDIR